MFSKRPCSRLGKVICQILTKSFYSLIELSNLGLRSFINRMIMGLGRLFEVELHPSVVIFTTQYLVNPVYHGILRYCENRDQREVCSYTQECQVNFYIVGWSIYACLTPIGALLMVTIQNRPA